MQIFSLQVLGPQLEELLKLGLCLDSVICRTRTCQFDSGPPSVTLKMAFHTKNTTRKKIVAICSQSVNRGSGWASYSQHEWDSCSRKDILSTKSTVDKTFTGSDYQYSHITMPVFNIHDQYFNCHIHLYLPYTFSNQLIFCFQEPWVFCHFLQYSTVSQFCPTRNHKKESNFATPILGTCKPRRIMLETSGCNVL